jgi:hypothetical protein
MFLFIEVSEEFLSAKKHENLEILESLKDTIKTQFGDFFDICNIIILKELPKRLKSTGEIGVDKE